MSEELSSPSPSLVDGITALDTKKNLSGETRTFPVVPISSEDIFFLTILNLPTLRFTLLNSSVSNSFSSPGRLALTILAATSFSFKRDK